MVQSKKHKNSKPRKQQPHVKKSGKKDDITEFRPQLDALGLKIVQVVADGNCFFRALADQLEGNEEEHQKYRLMVVKYIRDHRGEFEPFIEDGVPFDEYCQNMEKDGTWAGHMELQAGSLVTRRNICIHRMMSPRWYIRNFDGHASLMIHLSYHNEEHYNSVRLKEDPCNGPAKPVVIKADANLSATTNKAKDAVTKSKGSSCKNIDTGSVKLVMIGSGCEDADKVEQILHLLEGDVDAAIEFLIAEQGVDDDDVVGNSELPHKDDTPDGDCQLPELSQENTSEQDGPDNNDIKPANDDNSAEQSDKTIPRNKEKLYEWILRQQQEGSKVMTSDILSYLQNELDYAGEEPQVSQSTFMNPGNQVSSGSLGPVTAGQGPRPSLSDQAKNSVFSNALSSPVRRSLQHCQLNQGGYYLNNVTPSGNELRNTETYSNDSSMDMI